MAKHGHPSADHPLMRNPNSSSPQVFVVGSSLPPPPPPPPPLQTKMASFSGDFLTSGATASTTTAAKTKPLTMFYNGGVAVFHLPQDKVHGLCISVDLWFFCTTESDHSSSACIINLA
uniref:Tify domain-containing protein n=1 Tax=Setaria italica TaxID=4555 RepID=K3XNA0_SETIT